MQATMPRTRPTLSPSQPKLMPPMAAPMRKQAVIALIQHATVDSPAAQQVLKGRAGDQRRHADFHAVEHPPQERRCQRKPLPAGQRFRLIHDIHLGRDRFARAA